uniref:Uncharacterized protein n=1 Tax=Arundo donax TaxID=35708 RepID=A0A0A9FIC6_ARUDO
MNSSVGKVPSIRLSSLAIFPSRVCAITALHSRSCLYCCTRRFSC